MRSHEHAVGWPPFLVFILLGHASIGVAAPLDAAVEPPVQAESRAEERFRKGLRLAEANELDDAAEIFLRLTQEYPRLLEPYVQLAAIYQRQGNIQGAVDVLRAALKVQTDPARLYEQLGDLYLQLATQAYREALDTDHATATARTKYSRLEALGSGRAEK